jgi:hypothetical protein
MTTKELIHEKVELLDEDRAKLILTHVEDLLDDPDRETAVSRFGTPEVSDEARRAAMLSLIGMARSAEPTNIAEHKDEYIADAILHRDASTS